MSAPTTPSLSEQPALITFRVGQRGITYQEARERTHLQTSPPISSMATQETMPSTAMEVTTISMGAMEMIFSILALVVVTPMERQAMIPCLVVMGVTIFTVVEG